MVSPETPYPDVYTDTFIFFLRSLCKSIWMNVHYFPNAPRTLKGAVPWKKRTVDTFDGAECKRNQKYEANTEIE